MLCDFVVGYAAWPVMGAAVVAGAEDERAAAGAPAGAVDASPLGITAHNPEAGALLRGGPPRAPSEASTVATVVTEGTTAAATPAVEGAAAVAVAPTGGATNRHTLLLPCHSQQHPLTHYRQLPIICSFVNPFPV